MSGNLQKPGLMDNLGGAFDIMLGRETGLNRMDLSSDGFAWSCAGLGLAGLIDISALSMLYNNQVGPDPIDVGKTYYVAGHIVIALIGYAASLLALYLLCRTADEQKRFPTAVIVHNWAAPVVSLAFLPFLLFAGMVGQDTGGNTVLNLVSVFWIGVLIFVGLRIMRISLGVSSGKAALFFAISTAVSIICTEGLEAMVGLTAPS